MTPMPLITRAVPAARQILDVDAKPAVRARIARLFHAKDR
jgi:hypothetical protein